MTKLKITTHSGEIFTTVDTYDTALIEGNLNNRDIQVTTIGDVIVNKNAVIMVSPVEEPTTTTTV